MRDDDGGVPADASEAARDGGVPDPDGESGVAAESFRPDEVPPTGESSVDAVLGSLADLGGHPVGEHAEFYVALHDALLTELNAEG
ncbi:hypothetical protein E2F48_15880 [Arthrobacter crusticola]|uniref:Uncharacterized protein n=1 Tax=Arthrobacter crusticola TaxID=2547960 RepID=A0A4R5TPU9_9MICC|nr:hypothetical protein [Arthrobacter crusticola]TDK24228.1 hypothetical protein E2F48_15880 [Arthrobacter crusticola]